MFAALQTHPWAYPALEVVHLLGIGVLLGNLLLVEVRALGAAAELPLKGLARTALPLSLAGFALAAASGLAMFATQPQELLANRAFTLKMLLLFTAGSNAAWFHARGGLARLDRLAKAQLFTSLLLWVAVVACGRWIAYV